MKHQIIQNLRSLLLNSDANIEDAKRDIEVAVNDIADCKNIIESEEEKKAEIIKLISHIEKME